MKTLEKKLFAKRIESIPESFIREILKVSTQPDVISFAGGLPNPVLFPQEKIAEAAEKVLRIHGREALQYSVSEGYLPLRAYIAEKQSKKEGNKINAEEVLILNGSQQGLDLAGKLLINPNEKVLMEGPTYLGAIQAFSSYEPDFCEIKITDATLKQEEFISKLKTHYPKIFYTVPNFQNPTGNTYDLKVRHFIANEINKRDMILLEDNPYGEIFFENQNLPDLHALAPDKTIYLGSFSKIISPGLRLGWAIAPKKIIKKMTIVKQASDLHSNYLSQRIIYQYLLDNPIENHLEKIRSFYKLKCFKMMGLIKKYFPKEVQIIEPKGGMFIWATLPAHINTELLLSKTMEHRILFVPGNHFYTSLHPEKNSMRLNFSNPSEAEMEAGIEILGRLIYDKI